MDILITEELLKEIEFIGENETITYDHINSFITLINSLASICMNYERTECEKNNCSKY